MNQASAKILSDSRWEEAKFLIKANENEQFFLWKEHAKESLEKDRGLHWVTEGDSKSIVIDTVDDKPIAVCFTFVRLNGVLVVFYDAISRLVDWDLITEWLKTVWKAKWGKNKPAVCGFSTFKDCLKFIYIETGKDKKLVEKE